MKEAIEEQYKINFQAFIKPKSPPKPKNNYLLPLILVLVISTIITGGISLVIWKRKRLKKTAKNVK
jgi:hypothetical protein